LLDENLFPIRKERVGDVRYWPVAEVIAVLHPSDYHSLIRIDNQPRAASSHSAAVLELPFWSVVASIVNKPAESVLRLLAITRFLTREDHRESVLFQESRFQESGTEASEVLGGREEPAPSPLVAQVFIRGVPISSVSHDGIPARPIENNFVAFIGKGTLILVAATPPNVTFVAPVKLFPVIVTEVPTGPLVGLKLSTSGTTRNLALLLAVPPAVVMLIGPVFAPAATLAVTWVSEFTVKLAALPPMVTPVV
jgi:hypothetical protein